MLSGARNICGDSCGRFLMTAGSVGHSDSDWYQVSSWSKKKARELKNPRVEDEEPGLTQFRRVNSTTKQGSRQNINYED